MPLIDTGNDPWLVEYEACERLSREIMTQMSEREEVDATTKTYDALSAKIRIRLKQYSGEVEQLSEKLNLGSVVSQITDEERRRRKRLVEMLQNKDAQLQLQFKGRETVQRPNTFHPDRRAVFADLGTTSWGDIDEPEPEVTNNQTIGDLRSEQKKMVRAQDEGLEALSKVISKQKQIATSINAEVDEQNEILVDIADNMDRVDTRIERETNMVKVIGRKDSTWAYWVIILILLVVIIGVSLA